MTAIKYSFSFRYERDIIREVVIPDEKLAEINLLDGDLNWKIRELIDEDWDLLHALLGDDVRDYESKKAEADIWEKDLQRYNEQAVLIVQNAAE